MKSNSDILPMFHMDRIASLNGAQVIAPFRTVFPHLALSLQEKMAQASRIALKREAILVGVSALIMLSLLIMIFSLMSQVSRKLNVMQLRSDLLSRVSHELKTPLTLISLYNDTLMNDSTLPLEEQRKCLQVISRECGRLNNLIGNLLHSSKIDRAKVDYRIAEGDLAPVIQRTAEMCADWLRPQGFTVALDLAASLPPVRLDPERVTQALINLIDNARKFSGDSRSIEIRSSLEKNNVIVEVEDHGIGVPPGEYKRVFEQFYRASNARQQSGTGLGLYLVSDIMQAHSGSIELESELGAGSVFRLVFPAAEA
jgi:two-component system, OmpR family, phosphate regulon sensor histidine kinase PhoR